MRDDWFLAIDSAPADELGVAEKLLRARHTHSAALEERFALTGGRRLTVLWSGAARVVETARRWLWIAGPRPPGDALRRALGAADSAAALRAACTAPDGEAWSCFIVDKQAGDYGAIIDRFNLATILMAGIGGQRLLGSNLALFSRRGLTVDLGSAASYIVNGNSLNNRTIFREITRLARASIHDFRNGGHAQEIYWHYTPGQAARREPWRPAAAAAQLWELVVESVDRATRGKRVLLALSGGYDSGVLLGILGTRLRHPDVTCVRGPGALGPAPSVRPFQQAARPRLSLPQCPVPCRCPWRHRDGGSATAARPKSRAPGARRHRPGRDCDHRLDGAVALGFPAT